MEKLFRPNKWFVGFCGLLIVVFVSLQYVSRMRLQGLAQAWGKEIYTWVTGVQTLDWSGDQPQHSETECGAQLTFYKTNNDWVLGKVELQ
jgi:hypothetical protein